MLKSTDRSTKQEIKEAKENHKLSLQNPVQHDHVKGQFLEKLLSLATKTKYPEYQMVLKLA